MAFVIELLLGLCMSWQLTVVNCVPRARYPATKGELWPAAANQERFPDQIWSYDPAFGFETNQNCTKLDLATERYKIILDSMFSLTKTRTTKRRRQGNSIRGMKTITTLKIELTSTNGCDGYPPVTMDETYRMTIDDESHLRASYIWGILRGLESFTQLFYLANNYTEMLINGTLMLDHPEYLHRGVMIDTGKHFLSMKSIFATINALEMNKMNVLHWRLTDEESFPYEIDALEELAYGHPECI